MIRDINPIGVGMAEQKSGLFWGEEHSLAMQPDLSPLEKQLRDKFVEEYLFDRDPVAAAIRCGFNPAYARQYSGQFLQETYTLTRLKERQIVTHDEKEQAKRDKEATMTALREALQVGPYASRVQAARAMATIHGMEAPAKSEQTITHRGGVMAVPALANLAEWERAAMQSQEQLVSETRH